MAPSQSKVGMIATPDVGLKEKPVDVQSVITLDRLKKFNDI